MNWLTRHGRQSAMVIVVGAALIVALGASAASTVARRLPIRRTGLTRYSLVHGCFTLASPAGGRAMASGDGPFRMQAAALGVYLLYTPQDGYLIDQSGALTVDTSPSTAAEWQVTGSSATGFTMTNLAGGTPLPVVFKTARGCAVYPEAQVDATGQAFRGASPEAGVLGTVEGHAHVTAFGLFGGDWHCGTPWSAFGAPYALPASCAADEQGTNGEVESFVDFGGATRPSGFHGWPTFVDWPSPTTLAEEGDYWTGIERAWKAGLRIMVTNLVDNEALCNLMTTRSTPCNDMSSVKIQSRYLYELQDYIDAQSGGPGKGWFRIVTNPFQARQVINQGKLAVIEGIEVSRLFGCGEENNVPQCNEAQIDAGIKEVEGMGVRTFFPIHEFNNAFGGTKMIGGDLGILINAGNREETGSFWNLQPCPSDEQDAEQMTVPGTGALSGLLNGPLASALHGSAVPAYGSGPQCNTQGLTDLGDYLIGQMIKSHLIIQLDHMDSKTATAALGVATAAHYAGVVSAHCCSSPQLFKQIYDDGGFISEPAAPATSFVAQEKIDKSDSDPTYRFGFGYGSDMNGLADQPGPQPGTPITYPFKSYVGNVTFTREQWGQRSFDLNTDGVANYGMYADWLRDIQTVGGKPVMSAMFQGAEAYLEMWERADGVPATTCRAAGERFSATGLGRAIRLGKTTTATLFSAGQPVSRPGRSYRFCVTGRSGRSQRGPGVAAVFNAHGKVGLIGSDARGERAGGMRAGGSARTIGHAATRVARGLWIGRRLTSGSHYVYGVRDGKVRFVAVAAAAQVRRIQRLRADLRAAGL